MAYEMPHAKTLDADFMFTKLVVDDLEKSAKFYESVFGVVEMHRLEAVITGRKVSEVVYQSTYANGPMFILLKFHDAPKAITNELMLGFSTKDMDALLKRAEQAGGRTEQIQEDPNMGLRTAFIRDPEGHIVQISQRMA